MLQRLLGGGPTPDALMAMMQSGQGSSSVDPEKAPAHSLYSFGKEEQRGKSKLAWKGDHQARHKQRAWAQRQAEAKGQDALAACLLEQSSGSLSLVPIFDDTFLESEPSCMPCLLVSAVAGDLPPEDWAALELLAPCAIATMSGKMGGVRMALAYRLPNRQEEGMAPFSLRLMDTRTGAWVTLKDVIDARGPDFVRLDFVFPHHKEFGKEVKEEGCASVTEHDGVVRIARAPDTDEDVLVLMRVRLGDKFEFSVPLVHNRDKMSVSIENARRPEPGHPWLPGVQFMRVPVVANSSPVVLCTPEEISKMLTPKEAFKAFKKLYGCLRDHLVCRIVASLMDTSGDVCAGSLLAAACLVKFGGKCPAMIQNAWVRNLGSNNLKRGNCGHASGLWDRASDLYA